MTCDGQDDRKHRLDPAGDCRTGMRGTIAGRQARGWAGAVASALCALVLLVPDPASAQGVRPSDAVEANLRTGWRSDSTTHMAALHLRLAPGWITYWRVPGEGGLAPLLDWSGSHNVGAVTAHWPQPQLFDYPGYTSIGYADELVLPLEIALATPNQPSILNGQITIGVCRDICMPVDLSIRAELPSRGHPDPQITAALARAPRPAHEAGLRHVACMVEPHERGLSLAAELLMPPLHTDELVILELPDSPLWVRSLDTRRDGSTLTATAHVSAPPGKGDTALVIDRAAVRVTVLGGPQAVEHEGCSSRD